MKVSYVPFRLTVLIHMGNLLVYVPCS